MLQIKCINGEEDKSQNARGDRGYYNHVYSNLVEITIRNPCKQSIVNNNANLIIRDLPIPEGQTSLAYTYEGPSDSVSEQYGNGYDICGSLTYVITDLDGKPAQPPSNFIA